MKLLLIMTPPAGAIVLRGSGAVGGWSAVGGPCSVRPTTSRLGIAHDRWLIYGKTGVAYSHTNYTDNIVRLGLNFRLN